MPTLKELRKAKGLSQAELAVKIGVSTNTITRWEMAASQSDRNFIAPSGPAKRLLGVIFAVDSEDIQYNTGKSGPPALGVEPLAIDEFRRVIEGKGKADAE